MTTSNQRNVLRSKIMRLYMMYVLYVLSIIQFIKRSESIRWNVHIY